MTEQSLLKERAQLDNAILEVQRNLAAPPDSIRASYDVTELTDMLSRCVQQHRALLTELEKELAFEKCLNANFQELLADVQAVRSALKESANVPTSTHTETELLHALVRITEQAFTDPALCIQLRDVLELFLNALWESPEDPYVNVCGINAHVLDFLQQAGLVESHPDTPDALRLVAFHEPMPDPNASRPTLY